MRLYPEMTQISPDPAAGPRLLDRLTFEARRRRLALRTERAYRAWARRYILFHGKRHPSELGAEAVSEFLTALAVDLGVAAATQNQALAALLFLYREVLGLELGPLPEATRASRPKRLPVVLSRDEARRLVSQFAGVERLVVLLLYGGGLRLLEVLRLRVKDLDFDRHEITVRSGQGRPRSPDDAPRHRCARAPAASRGRAPMASAGSRVRVRASRAPRRPGAQASQCDGGVALAVGLPFDQICDRPEIRRKPPPSSLPGAHPARRQQALREPQGSPNESPATPCATASPPTSSKPATTSAPCRSSSATARSRPP